MIKVILIASVTLACWWLLRSGAGGSRLALTRIAGLLFTGAWVLGVLFPDVVTRAANAVGVGRGTDLLLYVLIVAFLFTSISSRQRLRELDDRIATLTRAQALHEHAAATRHELGSTST